MSSLRWYRATITVRRKDRPLDWPVLVVVRELVAFDARDALELASRKNSIAKLATAVETRAHEVFYTCSDGYPPWVERGGEPPVLEWDLDLDAIEKPEPKSIEARERARATVKGARAQAEAAEGAS
ncbi:MAG TPA: hypothetical protein VKE69_01050 [Planctomycetota bacterium]|nr:hypothetical protein [Planctomycetota bacterium]